MSNTKSNFDKYLTEEEQSVINHIKLLFQYAKSGNTPKVKKGINMLSSILAGLPESIETNKKQLEQNLTKK
jgi:hypothetical protein